MNPSITFFTLAPVNYDNKWFLAKIWAWSFTDDALFIVWNVLFRITVTTFNLYFLHFFQRNSWWSSNWWWTVGWDFLLPWNYFIDIVCLDFPVLDFIFGLFLSWCSTILSITSSSVIAFPPTTLLSVFLFFLAVCTFARIWPPLCNRKFSADSDKGLTGVIHSWPWLKVLAGATIGSLTCGLKGMIPHLLKADSMLLAVRVVV